MVKQNEKEGGFNARRKLLRPNKTTHSIGKANVTTKEPPKKKKKNHTPFSYFYASESSYLHFFLNGLSTSMMETTSSLSYVMENGTEAITYTLRHCHNEDETCQHELCRATLSAGKQVHGPLHGIYMLKEAWFSMDIQIKCTILYTIR